VPGFVDSQYMAPIVQATKQNKKKKKESRVYLQETQQKQEGRYTGSA